MKAFNKLLLAAIALLYLFLSSCDSKKISIYGNENTDLYALLESAGQNCQRYDNIETALEGTPPNGTLLVLAGGYPQQKTELPVDFYEKANAKGLKVYVEYPDRLPDALTGTIKATKKERLVVTSEFFGDKLPQMAILDAGLFSYVEVSDRKSHLKGANVAGFDRAVYGLGNTPNVPILFEEGNMLIATTKLSDFQKSRYSPLGSWKNAFVGLLSYLSIGLEEDALTWSPLVKPTYTANSPLPADAYQNAVERGVDWYIKGRFLIHPDWQAHWQRIDTLPLPVGPPMDLSLPSGDGSLGVMEGHYSYINPDGSQPYRYWLRADCTAETAMVFSLLNDLEAEEAESQVAENLLDFLFNTDAFKSPSSKDLNMSSYGLTGWAATRKTRYYGDDNARVILGAIMATRGIKKDKWDTQILELILANFRTSGEKGFRGNALNGSDIDQKTWQMLMKGRLENPAPHYESWLWATYLWLYDKTGYQPLLDKAKRAIEITMNNYPDRWIWTNGIQQERARMILPLAWLVRVEDNQQHRDWLSRVCDDLLKNQLASGALREELGENSKGKYGTPKSNEQYGHNEAPVIHANGDPVADMLYTSNFAFFALNEAAQATQEPEYLEAVDKLADFLVRIQSSSSGRADLDGCWFRAFDYERWEYYGSNADHGWGAWGTLTGWTQSFITTTLALKMQQTSYWDFTKGSTIGRNIDEVWQRMLPGKIMNK